MNDLLEVLKTATPEQTAQLLTFAKASAPQYKELAMALAIWFWAIWPGIGIGLIGKSALEAIGRNPNAQAKVQSMAILTIAFAEAVAIYALVIALIIGFAM